MRRPIGANRLLHVFGGEVIEYEEAISDAFSMLVGLSSYTGPSAKLIHRAVRRILADSAMISLIFFPSRRSKHSDERSEFLRVEFVVDEKSLLKSRALRNHVAHLDERIDRWAIESDMRTFGRGMLGSREDAERHGLNEEDILGLFDVRSLTYSFLKDDLQVDDLVGEIRAISHRIHRKLRDLPWHEEPH